MLKRFFYFLFFIVITLAAHCAQAANSSIAENLLNRITSEEEFLSPDKAFGLELDLSGNQINVHFNVANGYYLYKERIKFSITPPSRYEIQLPSGEIKNDPNFGKMEVYHHSFNGNIQLQTPITAALTVQASYQGCSEKGLCYAPQHKTFVLQPSTAANPDASGSSTIDSNKFKATDVQSNDISANDSNAANLLKSGKWWLIILGFFSAGLLLSFTPCVFPMIPILSSIIIGKNAHVTRLHAFNLSLAYTFGMCLTYTLAGIAAGLSGQMLSNALQTPWALALGALIFAVLALSMFGFYELKLPTSLENSLMSMSRRIKGGKFFSDFLMGVLSALIISPCVAAPLAGALLYISKTHDVVLGGVALFSLSLGMGTPLLLIGASAGSLLPKVGSWMNAVRNLFGVLMLAVALWLITPIIPISVQLALWSALLIVPAIFMHALDPLPVDAKPALRFWKGIAIMLLMVGLAMLVGALSNAKSPLQPLSGLMSSNIGGTSQNTSLNFKKIKNLEELDQHLKLAQGRYVMLDFYADWCVACKELEQFTFSDTRVKAALENTVLLQADVTQNNAEDKALLQKFNLFGPPGIIFFNTLGREETQLKIVGYKNPEDFLQTLNLRGSCLPETLQC